MIYLSFLVLLDIFKVLNYPKKSINLSSTLKTFEKI